MNYLLGMAVSKKDVRSFCLNNIRQISAPDAFFRSIPQTGPWVRAQKTILLSSPLAESTTTVLGRSRFRAMTQNILLQAQLNQTKISMAVSRGSICGKNTSHANDISEWISIRVVFSAVLCPSIWILSVPGVANLAFYIDGRRQTMVGPATKRTCGGINIHVLRQLHQRQWQTCIRQVLYFQTV